MLTSNARVATERPKRYLRQLCEHFADAGRRHGDQEFDVTFDDRGGFVDFSPVVSGSCRVDAMQQGMLVLDASGTDQIALERVQRIVARHVERFGRGDGLTVEWSPAAEQPSMPRRGTGLP